MITIIKIIITTILSFLFLSCNFNMGVQGNGDVQIGERPITETFSSIDVSTGINVYLTQSDMESVCVEADENLHNLIVTEVKNHVLKIYTTQNIGHASSKKVMVSFIDVSKISSSSGSSIHSNNSIKSNHIELSTSSGSTMKLDINTNSLKCNSSSGSALKISGTTNNLTAKSASGSTINAADLTAISSNVKAYSGSKTTIKTTKELTASASSGANVTYFGAPEKVTKSNSSGGNVSSK